MKHDRIDDMVKGWFVGAFAPTAFATDACEVGVKRYEAGAHEGRHMHKIATEITMIAEGRVRMCGQEFERGDIITIEPGEATDFTALTDVITVVVKVPGALDDKYALDEG
jgi:quercetin dioxygenase-like cupin family protein